jgi:hypothetical protein
MPQPPPNYTIDPWRALVRHVVMSEEIENGKRRPVLVRRRATAALEMPVISDESRAQYEYELTERAGSYMDAGMSEQEADIEATADLGCVEFWDYLQSTGGYCGSTDDEVEEMERAA